MTWLAHTFTDFQLGLLSFPLLLILIFVRLPLAVAMLGVGLLGKILVEGKVNGAQNLLKQQMFTEFSTYSLSVIPLFLLMSEFATQGGMSRALFKAAEAFLGHRKGGLAMAAIGASAGFGAICGSSLATASTMGRVALPELQRAGYSGSLATGALAAGGTLGILIPPSIVLVIFGILAEANIERLFVAAFIPGILAMLGYMLTISIYVRVIQGAEQDRPRLPYAARIKPLADVLPVFGIFLTVVGGIYTGVFSPTAAAGIGAGLTFLVALIVRLRGGHRDYAWIGEALVNTTKTSAAILFIVVGAKVFNSFLASAQVPQTIAMFFDGADFSPWLVLAGMLLLYLVLGTIMDSIAMIFLTVPIFIPIILGLDFGLDEGEVLIWFGILVLMSAEVGLITPPVGLNLFVINAMSDRVNITETYRGVLPFVVSDIIRIALLATFPLITLQLVRWVYPVIAA